MNTLREVALHLIHRYCCSRCPTDTPQYSRAVPRGRGNHCKIRRNLSHIVSAVEETWLKLSWPMHRVRCAPSSSVSRPAPWGSPVHFICCRRQSAFRLRTARSIRSSARFLTFLTRQRLQAVGVSCMRCLWKGGAVTSIERSSLPSAQLRVGRNVVNMTPILMRYQRARVVLLLLGHFSPVAGFS